MKKLLITIFLLSLTPYLLAEDEEQDSQINSQNQQAIDNFAEQEKETHYASGEYQQMNSRPGGGGPDMMGQLLNGVMTFATSYVGVSTLKSCSIRKVPSMITFQASSGAYLFAEVNNMLGLVGKQSSQAQDYVNSDGKSKQSNAFRAAAGQKLEQADKMQTKGQIQDLAAKGYLASAAVALGEYTLFTMAANSCRAKMSSLASAASARAATCAAPHSGCSHEVGPASSAASQASATIGQMSAAEAAMMATGSAPAFAGVDAAFEAMFATASSAASNASKTAVAGQGAAALAACQKARALKEVSHVACNGGVESASVKNPCEKKISDEEFIQFLKGQKSLAHNMLKFNAFQTKVSESIWKAEGEVDAYFIYDEYRALASGAEKSISIESYEVARKNYGEFLAVLDYKFEQENKAKAYLVASLSRVGEVLFPTAQANGFQDMLPLLGLGGGAILAMFDGQKTLIGNLMLKWLGSPLQRSVMFGVFGAMAQVTASNSKKAAEQMRSEGQGLLAMAQKMESMQAAANERRAAINLQDPSLQKSRAMEGLAYPHLSAACLSGGGDVGGCECQKNNSCHKFSHVRKDFLKASLPGSDPVNQVSNDISRVGGLLAEGKTSEASLLASDANKKVSSQTLSQSIRDLQSKANKVGNKKYDFAANRKKFENTLNQQSKKAFHQGGGAAALSGNSVFVASVAARPFQKTKNTTAYNAKTRYQGVRGLPSSTSGQSSDFLLWDEKNKAREKENQASSHNQLRKIWRRHASKAEKQESGKGTLWDRISHRYFSSIPLLVPEE